MEMDVVARGLAFPEGPIALADGTLLVVEVAGGRLSKIARDGTVTTVADVGGGPSGAALGPDGACYICNSGGLDWRRDSAGAWHVTGPAASNRGGLIQRVDLTTGEVQALYESSDDVPLPFPNDLVFDRAGGFWFTDIGMVRPGQRRRDIGSVYYALPDGSRITEVIHPITSPNGIGLSRDESVLYVAETEGARMWAFTIDEPGVIRPEPWPSPNGGRLLAAAGDHVYKRFDSLAVDATGAVVVGTLVHGGLTVIPPEGGLATHIPLPDAFVTSVCFGGENLQTAFVTQAYSGTVASLPWPDGGLPLNWADTAGNPAREHERNK